MRKWLGHHQEISRAGLIGKRREVRKKKRVEAGARRETEVPEIIIVSDAVESTKVDLDGRSHREQAEGKNREEKYQAKRVRRKGKWFEWNQKKRRITLEKQRVRSRKKWKRGFLYQVRSVFRRKRCIVVTSKQCSEKSLSYWQLASVVIDKGTTKLCQKCFNNSLQAEGEKPLTNVQWRQVVEKKA